MIATVFGVAALVTLALMVPFLWRVAVGPTVFDRVQAINGMGTLAAVVMVAVGLAYDRVDMFVDLVLAMFAVNLFTTLLIARYVRDRAQRRVGGPRMGEVRR